MLLTQHIVLSDVDYQAWNDMVICLKSAEIKNKNWKMIHAFFLLFFVALTIGICYEETFLAERKEHGDEICFESTY